MSTWNPLLDLWWETTTGRTDADFFNDLLGIDPALVSAAARDLAATYAIGTKARHDACETYAWAIPGPEAIELLVKHNPLVEVGAGTGYWARVLSDAGADVVAYDLYPPDRDWIWTPPFHRHHHKPAAKEMFFDVERRGPRGSAQRHPDRTLLLCWPPYNEPMAHCALQAHRQTGGTTVAYVGEGHGGCTGDGDFHDYLDEHYELIDSTFIPQWPGLHDWLSIYQLEAGH